MGLYVAYTVSVQCPVGSRNLDLSVRAGVSGLLQKRKQHGSDRRLYSRLFRRHPALLFSSFKKRNITQRKTYFEDVLKLNKYFAPVLELS